MGVKTTEQLPFAPEAKHLLHIARSDRKIILNIDETFGKSEKSIISQTTHFKYEFFAMELLRCVLKPVLVVPYPFSGLSQAVCSGLSQQNSKPLPRPLNADLARVDLQVNISLSRNWNRIASNDGSDYCSLIQHT